MILLVRHPDSRAPERGYIYDVVLRQWLGLDFRMISEERTDVKITLQSRPEQASLVVNDSFFRCNDLIWLKEASLPSCPLVQWDTRQDFQSQRWSRFLPILYGEPLDNGGYYQRDGARAQLGLDIFGSAFFMLTRYEELVVRTRDHYDRFPAQSSVSYRGGFLHRPIVDEYVELLWACMEALWPELKRKRHSYRFFLSCDVDRPFFGDANGSFRRAFRAAAGDVVWGRGFGSAINRFKIAFRNSRGEYHKDPNNTFGFMMDIAEQHGLRLAFYFISGHSGGAIDGNYRLSMPWIRKLMRTLFDRGHEIGLHPSFNTYLDGKQLGLEYENLLQTAEEIGIQQSSWGGRQHYLRWRAPETWQLWQEVGLNYDTTLGYADHVGFRAGTCRDFPVFSLRNRNYLELRERPLIVMEGTLLGSQYMNLGGAEALGWIEQMASTCKRFDGNFTLLWHNSMLLRDEHKVLFRDAIEIAAD